MIAISAERVVLPGHDLPQAYTIVADIVTGKVVALLPGKRAPLGPAYPAGDIRWIDVEDRLIVSPGLVDAHVHLNEPGRTAWEGFESGTQAAVSGGITTLVDMPLNSIPPTTTLPHLEIKRQAAKGHCWSDVAFWAGVVPGNQSHLKSLIEAGCKGFKCFLIESGVEEFPCVDEQELRRSMQVLQHEPTVLLFHAELDQPSVKSTVTITDDSDQIANTLYSTFLESRPQKMETDAISLITRLQPLYPSLRCHIVHLSASSALPLIRIAKTSGINLTVETCFHYLCLSSEDVPDGRPEFKCCPPIRERSNRELLWKAVQDGVIDCVVSDHSPCVAELKKLDEGDVMNAWGGISTLGLGLSLLWTEGRKRGVTLNQIVEWTSTKPAIHAGLGNIKGQLGVGYDADLIFWDPEALWTVTKDRMNFKNKLSPYEGLTLQGRVEKTFVRGQLVYSYEKGFDGLSPIGRLL